jgi:hypothetical protein
MLKLYIIRTKKSVQEALKLLNLFVCVKMYVCVCLYAFISIQRKFFLCMTVLVCQLIKNKKKNKNI